MTVGQQGYEAGRRVIDVMLASVMLVASLPVLLPAALAVLVTSGRPVFFGHRRLGRGRVSFRCWKLRTMEVAAEKRLERDAELGSLHRANGFKLPTHDDPRVTRVGKVLRRRYVDEIPQLVNVIKGDLSLVGPRPVIEQELEEFGDEADELLTVRPGIFGAWNSLGPKRPPYPERARVELEYVRGRSLRRDAAILLRSIGTVALGEPVESNGSGTRPAASPHPRTLRRTLRNAIALLFAYLLPRGFSFASVVVAARALGAADFGAYGTAAAFAVILSIVATLGMTPLLIRDIARDRTRAPALLRAAHLVKTGANVVMMVLIVALARALDYEPDVMWASVLLGLGYALGAYAENLAAYFQALERMHLWTQASALFGMVSGVGGIALVLATRDIVWFCLSPALGWAVALAWLMARTPASVRWGESVRRDEVVSLLRSLAPFAAAFALMVVYYKVDVLLLARWTSTEVVGLYAAGYKFVDIFQAIVVVASAAVYPRLSRLSGMRGRERSPGARTTEILILAALPAAGVLHFLSDPLIALLYGETYAVSSGILRVLAFVLPSLAVTIHGGYVLAAAGRMASVAALYVGGLALNLTLNALLIPQLGGRGAALAMVASEAALAIAFVWVLGALAKAAPGRRVLLAAGLALASGAAISAVATLLGPYGSAVVFVLALSAVYPLTGAFGLHEARMLGSALRPRRGAGTRP